RQLGLAHLAFSGATHDRLEHIIGVVAAVERMTHAIELHIRRWNQNAKNRDRPLPLIRKGDRHRLRLAAMFHDLGLGPFGHAIEPVLQEASPLGAASAPDGSRWREQIVSARNVLEQNYSLHDAPSPSEVIAVMIVMSEPVAQLFASDRFMIERWAS